jgi:2-polyprenyl-6-methoxyphenol hydroxylase-like FAD-dependent oxidoreductase
MTVDNAVDTTRHGTGAADDRERIPVLIAGGGPVGLALSLVLARYGVPSLVLEARAAPTPPDESRAITWMPRGLELLDWLGLSESFRARGVRRTRHEFWSGGAAGTAGRRLLTLPFDRVRSAHPYTLQLPQHDTETMLEEAARRTGLVELRRGHTVVRIGQDDRAAFAEAEGPAGTYRVEAPWAVACDGARSTVRRLLGIGVRWRDYGAASVVADFEMACGLPTDASRVVLDHRRPYGFFYFAPGRWRLIYRVNCGEDRREAQSEGAATALLRSYLPDAEVRRFLWASAFRLRQGQSETYRAGRWLLAGDAAHAMGPSAGAGMMVGVLGAWRLGWRLAQALSRAADPEPLLSGYESEQRAAAREVQRANALIFRNIAITDPAPAALRTTLLAAAGCIPAVGRRMAETEALLTQPMVAPPPLFTQPGLADVVRV